MVNTAGCGPVMRGFDPHRSPQKKILNVILSDNIAFFFMKNKIIYNLSVHIKITTDMNEVSNFNDASKKFVINKKLM